VRIAFNEAISRFAGIVAQICGTSGALKTATGEILSGAKMKRSSRSPRRWSGSARNVQVQRR
jgi:transcription termination factor Rho